MRQPPEALKSVSALQICMANQMNEQQPDWRERAAAALADHSVPECRAEVVALIEVGYTHSEVADELGLDHRS